MAKTKQTLLVKMTNSASKRDFPINDKFCVIKCILMKNDKFCDVKFSILIFLLSVLLQRNSEFFFKKVEVS